MKKTLVWSSDHFCGHKVSDYGIEHGYVDYHTLAKAFDAVLNNDIIPKTCDIGYWELVNGEDYNEEYGDPVEIFQYYIVSDAGAEILQDYTDEILYYNEDLDMYVWGVTHWGTSWDYVLTDIKLGNK